MSIRTCIKAKVKANKISKDKAKELLERYDNRVAQLEAAGFAPDQAKQQATADLMAALKTQADRSKRVANLRIQAAQRITDTILNKADSAIEGAEAHFFPDVNVENVNVPNIDIEHEVVRNMFHSKFVDGIQALRPRLSGLKRNTAQLNNVVREIFGTGSGDDLARTIAKSWKDTAELARRMFNDLGGAISKRADWGLPQMHDMTKVGDVPADEWIEFILPKLNRLKMTDDLGEPLSEKGLRDALQKTYDRIRTDGLIDLTPGTAGGKAFANRHMDHRFLVFKDADAWIEYQGKFGSDDIYGTMVHHLDSMAKEIAAMRVLGPNPQHMVRYIEGLVKQDYAKRGEPLPKMKFTFGMVDRLKLINDAWDSYTGKTSNPVNTGFANVMAGTRSTLHSALLGSAFLSALPTDPFFQAMTRRLNGLRMTRMLRQYVDLMFREKDIQLAVQVMGSAENWTSQGLAITRYFGDFNGPKVTRFFADAVMNASFLSQLTQAGQHAYGMTTLGNMARLSGKNFDQIDTAFRDSLRRYGISKNEWNVIRKSNFIQDRNGANYVNPNELAKSGQLEVANKIQRLIVSEGRFARPFVGLKTKALLQQGTRAGDPAGEATRSIAMFKSFPVEILTTHLARYASMNGAKRGRWMMTFMTGTMMMGALAVQMKQLASGKDPRNMDATTMEGMKFWASAAAQGGGLGIFGDFFFSDANRFGGGPLATALGPVYGLGEDLWKITWGNVQNLIGGEDINFGDELIQFARRYTPGSNLWYTKLAFQRLWIDQLSMMADPKANARFKRIESNTRKEYGQRYWWRPGKALPDRAPDLSATTE